MNRLDSLFYLIIKEVFQSLMREGLNHLCISVTRGVTYVKKIEVHLLEILPAMVVYLRLYFELTWVSFKFIQTYSECTQ